MTKTAAPLTHYSEPSALASLCYLAERGASATSRGIAHALDVTAARDPVHALRSWLRGRRGTATAGPGSPGF